MNESSSVVGIVTAGICFIVFVVSASMCSRDIRFIHSGYEQVYIDGAGVYWKKIDEPTEDEKE